MDSMQQRYFDLAQISLSLSTESDRTQLLQRIIEAAMRLTHADGGTFYLVDSGVNLRVEVIKNRSLAIDWAAANGADLEFPSIPFTDAKGAAQEKHLAAAAVNRRSSICIADCKVANDFDLSGVRQFDERNSYETRSILTVPLYDNCGIALGALQLINGQSDTQPGIAFSEADVLLVESFASLAAVAIYNNRLVQDQKNLFESFIEVLARAIDEKSPHTGDHCRKVPELTISLVNALHDWSEGEFSDFKLNDDDRYELKIAAWLHDCGKVTTPEYVIDKATKLQTLHDRLNEVNQRFETLARDLRIEMLEAQLRSPDNAYEAEQNYRRKLEQLESDRVFISAANTGDEFMAPEQQQRVAAIAARYSWRDSAGESHAILTDDEVYNLQISRGTLTAEERAIINRHINVTIDMLEALQLPETLKNIPAIAGGHHERMDGQGYPKGLKRDELCVQTRAMGIADIFEALTSASRPYKDAKTLSESLGIMRKMGEGGHIDPDIFEVFLRSGVYQEYADKFLLPNQIDSVDINDYLIGSAAD